MGDIKINEKTLFSQSGSDEPSMGSTITDIPAAGVTGVLPNTVTLKPNSIKTVTNTYDYIKGGELNSLGYLNHNFFGCSYYLSGSKTIADDSWVELDATWTKILSSGASGSDDADIFGKFGTTTGRWTPTISGYYLCVFNAFIDGYIDDGEILQAQIRFNSSGNDGKYGGIYKAISPGTNNSLAVSGGIILPCDTNDYISLWVYHNEGSGQAVQAGLCQISFAYMGTSDL